VVSKPDNITKVNKSASDLLFNGDFQYYEQQNYTIVALQLVGISEMDLDRNSYMTISVRNLAEYFDSNISANNGKIQSKLLEILSQGIENDLSKGFPPELLNKNSTITLDDRPAFQIIYEPLGCFCQEANIIVKHYGKLYDIYLHAVEFRADKALKDLNNITSSFRFLN
jgi:hypothetical protein